MLVDGSVKPQYTLFAGASNLAAGLAGGFSGLAAGELAASSFRFGPHTLVRFLLAHPTWQPMLRPLQVSYLPYCCFTAVLLLLYYFFFAGASNLASGLAGGFSGFAAGELLV